MENCLNSHTHTPYKCCKLFSFFYSRSNHLAGMQQQRTHNLWSTKITAFFDVVTARENHLIFLFIFVSAVLQVHLVSLIAIRLSTILSPPTNRDYVCVCVFFLRLDIMSSLCQKCEIMMTLSILQNLIYDDCRKFCSNLPLLFSHFNCEAEYLFELFKGISLDLLTHIGQNVSVCVCVRV